MLNGMELKDIRSRLKVMGKSQAALARHIGLDPSSLVKTIDGERRLQAAELRGMEEFFGEKIIIGSAAEAPHIATRRQASARRVPVYGYAAAGGSDRIALADDQVLEWREPPPYWNGAGELIYVRIIGDSMEPRYFSGEVVPIRRGVPPAKHDDCLIEFNDNSVLIKTYEAQRDGKVFARQYNPTETMNFDASSVRALHSVWRPSLI